MVIPPLKAQLLFSYGAKLDTVDHNGHSALTWAVTHNRSRTIDKLIKVGALDVVEQEMNRPHFTLRFTQPNTQSHTISRSAQDNSAHRNRNYRRSA